MLPKVGFVDQIADAYEHLYDLMYLRACPLSELLVPDPALSRKDRAWQLHHILSDAIEELDPGPQAPVFSREWRRHRLMVLRYTEGLDPQAVADQLAISRRHYYRERKAAIKAIADFLWDRCIVRPTTSRQTSDAVEPASLTRLELLRLEAARIAQADRYTQLSGVIHGVLSLLQEILRQRRLNVYLELLERLPDVSVDEGLLRQMLLGVLGYLIARAERTTIRLVAQVEESAVCLSVKVDASASLQPTARAELEEQLSTLEEMATLSSAHILPVYAEQSIVGFDIRLPTDPQRTVLVVDDNQDVLELFRRYLSLHRYRVVTAQTAQDALDLARRLQPYAITLDLMMPDRDGWDLLQALLNHPSTCHIPIIVCTVLKQKELALSLGATAFMEKPVTERALLSVLSALEEP